jgi:DNA-binding NtrC family response regulator
MTGQVKTGAILRVLMVEDCEDDALCLERELTRGGYKLLVTRLNNPCAMGAALHDHVWDLVLADWNLQRFSGLFAFEMLKCHGLDIPFIIVSGTIGDEAATTLAPRTLGRTECS